MRTLQKSKWTRFSALGALLCLLGFAPDLVAMSQDEAKKEEAEEDDDESSEEEEDRWLAVMGGDIHPGHGGVLRGAGLLAKNGKIEEIGYDLDLPEGAEVVDATGMFVYPGLIAMSSQGLFGGNADLGNTFDPFGQNIVLGLSAGITAAVQGNEAAKLKRGEVKDTVVTSNIFSTFPYSNRDPNGKRKLRERFEEAAEYVRKLREWEVEVKKKKELKAPKAPKDSSAVDVLMGKRFARFASNSRVDLLGIARIAQEFGFRPVIEGCVEGWTVADELGRAGAFAIVTPRARSAKRESLVRAGGSSIENAAILHRAGVQVAIVPGIRGIDLGGTVGRDLLHLPIEAGYAIRGGLPEQAALEGLTVVPARLLKLGHRLGALEVGKDCDLIVTDGDVLHYQTFVQWAVVDGKVAYDKQDELFFAHIRPRPESALAPEKKVDAGETEEEAAPAEEEDAEAEEEDAEEDSEEEED